MKTLLIIVGVIAVLYLLLVLASWWSRKRYDRWWIEYIERTVPPENIAYFDKDGNRI